jgi:hypothetical protein
VFHQLQPSSPGHNTKNVSNKKSFVKRCRYHFVYRWSVGTSSIFARLALLSLSGSLVARVAESSLLSILPLLHLHFHHAWYVLSSY